MYEAVIGLEIHSQLLTRSKLFCQCQTIYNSEPNTHTCPVCLGLPGALPVLNRQAVRYAVKAALAMNLTVNSQSYFARKNYFYPDLPKGYQITQYETPLSRKGYLDIDGKKIGINRIHLEEDAGKSIHHEKSSKTLIDFNRSGIPLIEIVTEPEMTTPQEAIAFLQTLRLTLMYLGISDGNMEEGSLRCDGNISVRQKGAPLPHYKVEIKNLNSFRFLGRALEYEFREQVEKLGKKETIESCTKLWDTAANRTRLMRRKEEEFDYRYFPEPDLGCLRIDPEEIKQLKQEIPELPQPKKHRFMDRYDMDDRAASFYMSNPDLADFFDAAARISTQYKKIDSWLRTELMKILNAENKKINQTRLTVDNLCQLIQLTENGKITGKIAKDIFPDLLDGKNPDQIIADRDIQSVDDQEELAAMIRQLIDDNPKEVHKYRQGNKKIMAFFVGRIMGQTKGQADPQVVTRLVREFLGD